MGKKDKVKDEEADFLSSMVEEDSIPAPKAKGAKEKFRESLSREPAAAAEEGKKSGEGAKASVRGGNRAITVTEEFKEAYDYINGTRGSAFVTGDAGTGKCHTRGTKITMYDGSIKPVERIKKGDLVMGDDSTSRLVVGTNSGYGKCYMIIPNKFGDKFGVNEEHVLVLWVSSQSRGKVNKLPRIIEMTVREYLASSNAFKRQAKLVRSPIEYAERGIEIDPYFVGLWLGDGTWYKPIITTDASDVEVVEWLHSYASKLGMKVTETKENGTANCYRYSLVKKSPKNGQDGGVPSKLMDLMNRYGLNKKSKKLPDEFLTSGKKFRLSLLAGYIDSDGSKMCEGGYEVYSCRRESLKQIQTVCRSLGYATRVKPKTVKAAGKAKRSGGKERFLGYRLYISGAHDIPCLLPHKKSSPRKIKKSCLVEKFSVKPIGTRQFFGFGLDGNHRYLLGDTTVTHNSTFVEHLLRTSRKKFVLLAPTGVAAVNIGGQTIHSFFKFPPRPFRPIDIARNANDWTKMLCRKLDCIIIDEISMVRVDMVDAIDFFLKYVLDSDKPFGGKQVIMIGDLNQLPPIMKTEAEREMVLTNWENEYFFSANVLRLMDYGKFYFTRNFRQRDGRFVEILNKIKSGIISCEELEEINTTCYKGGKVNYSNNLTICSTNSMADHINDMELSKVEGPRVELFGDLEGTFNPKNVPVDEVITLKVGCRVMMRNNDMQGRWINGTIGYVKDISADKKTLLVTIDGKDQTVERNKYESNVYSYDSKTKEITTKSVGAFTQFPVTAAYAYTIHKGQGHTYDRINIDMGSGAFAAGQLYVALSRCQTMDGITLLRKLKIDDVIVDYRVTKFLNDIKIKN